jgi:hypothetical protein
MALVVSCLLAAAVPRAHGVAGDLSFCGRLLGKPCKECLRRHGGYPLTVLLGQCLIERAREARQESALQRNDEHPLEAGRQAFLDVPQLMTAARSHRYLAGYALFTSREGHVNPAASGQLMFKLDLEPAILRPGAKEALQVLVLGAAAALGRRFGARQRFYGLRWPLQFGADLRTGYGPFGAPGAISGFLYRLRWLFGGRYLLGGESGPRYSPPLKTQSTKLPSAS